MTEMTQSVVGIHVADPSLPGRFYLTPDYCLTKDKSKAKVFGPCELHKGLREIKKFGKSSFTQDVTASQPTH